MMFTSLAAIVALVVATAALSCNEQTDWEPDPTTLALSTRPPPTRLPLGDLRVVDLNIQIWLRDIFGNDAVGTSRDGELWLLNVNSGKVRQLTNDGHRKFDTALSADFVAWTDQRREIQLPDRGHGPRFANDVFVRNLHTGEERQITDVPAERRGLRISGSHLVWQDNRHELEENYTHYDIYAYDLLNEREFPVAVAPGAQLRPAIYGDTVVWTDNRNSPQRDTTKSGCSNCADNRFDIYSYNLATGEERPLVETGQHNGPPSIHEQLVVWQQIRDAGQSVIVMLDLETGLQKIIGAGGRGSSIPFVSDEYVVWAVRAACDVFPYPPEVQTGVFAYRLDTGEVRQLSNYVEPLALLHGNVAVVAQLCFGINRQYAVFLD